MTESDLSWSNDFSRDIQFGYVHATTTGGGHYNPRLVVNTTDSTVEHALLEELGQCDRFTFSVAFISAAAIAQLKQHLIEFNGAGRVITSTFLQFNQPTAFAELLKLREFLGIDVRIHRAEGFHPKGYVFERARVVNAIVGSSNLTSHALTQNHELNLRVSAANGSDLAIQLAHLVARQVADSEPLTQEWIDAYAETYLAPEWRVRASRTAPATTSAGSTITPNAMQEDALLALDFARAEGARRAIIVSATGTGKTMLSALDVRAVDPARLLFIAHREQILDRTVTEYARALDSSHAELGKFTSSAKQLDRRYVFATIQSLSQPSTLDSIPSDQFDYIIIDEAHRAGSPSYQRVIDHFEPRFLLGMTATPERTDGFNVFELFHYNVPYEIRLNRALESQMLSPFHYYGISDVTFDDGTTTSDGTRLQRLVSPERVDHILHALDLYGQAGVAPRGLIFCGTTDEARALSAELNLRTLRGRPLRTVALTGDDPVPLRDQQVLLLESGEIDYILTVDIFNEGIDIPTINQVIMLRQTQSAIVFVQQLGRGLRLANGKDYLIVIDFIGNYANNFMIPIALFGDESLNREVLRERLNETLEAGALPGLSSVSFDEVSRERVLQSIAATQLDSHQRLKAALLAMQRRVGRPPELRDFYRFDSVDPVVLATRREHFPALRAALIQVPSNLDASASRSLGLVSHEVVAAKRLHEVILLEHLIEEGSSSRFEFAQLLQEAGVISDAWSIQSAFDTLTLTGYSLSDTRRYLVGVAEQEDDRVRLTEDFRSALTNSPPLAAAIADALQTARSLIADRYDASRLFTPGMQYSRRDAARIVGWSRSTSSTIYGYKTDEARKVSTIFVTLDKADDVVASTAYEDALLDPSTMRWFSKSRRKLTSPDVRGIVSGTVEIHVFVKKDDAEGSDHYYLGRATACEAVETAMPGVDGESLPVVRMQLKFDTPVRQGLFDYFRQVGGPSIL